MIPSSCTRAPLENRPRTSLKNSFAVMSRLSKLEMVSNCKRCRFFGDVVKKFQTLDRSRLVSTSSQQNPPRGTSNIIIVFMLRQSGPCSVQCAGRCRFLPLQPCQSAASHCFTVFGRYRCRAPLINIVSRVLWNNTPDLVP